MLLLSGYWVFALINIIWDAYFLVAMMDPNPLNDSVQACSIPTGIISRGHGNAECIQRSEHWLPVEIIVCEPRTERHQYCMIRITDLRTLGTSAGPSWMALEDIAKEGLLIPQSPACSITIRSQLGLHQGGTLRYRDML